MLTVSSCLEEVGEFSPPDPVRSFHQALPALSCRLVLSSHGQELLGLTAHGQCCDAEQIHAPLATPKKLGNSSSGPKYSAGSRGFANRRQKPTIPSQPSFNHAFLGFLIQAQSLQIQWCVAIRSQRSPPPRSSKRNLKLPLPRSGLGPGR